LKESRAVFPRHSLAVNKNNTAQQTQQTQDSQSKVASQVTFMTV
jgi:hypothetical protein